MDAALDGIRVGPEAWLGYNVKVKVDAAYDPARNCDSIPTHFSAAADGNGWGTDAVSLPISSAVLAVRSHFSERKIKDKYGFKHCVTLTRSAVD